MILFHSRRGQGQQSIFPSSVLSTYVMSVKTVYLSETQQADSINFLYSLLSVKIVQIVYWGITQQTDPICLLGPLLTSLSVQFYFPDDSPDQLPCIRPSGSS